jgi:hypothetical protein
MDRHKMVSGDAHGVVRVTNMHTLQATHVLRQQKDWVMHVAMQDRCARCVTLARRI